MKIINYLFLTSLLLVSVLVYPQLNSRETVNEDQYENLQIGYSKTTSIVFPYSIKSVDKGSADVLVQKAKGVENILLLKAAKQYFFQTNLTVVTTDARLYVFVLNYNEDCPDLNIKAENAAAASKDVLFSMENENQKKIEQLASLVLSKKKKTSGLKKSKFQIRLEVNGIFIHQDVLYLRVVFENKSKINYDIDQLRFFIRDQRKSKRTASQEIEILPLYTTSSSAVIPYKSEVIKVYALEKFTIPENKYLTLQLIEKNGGRHLEVNINNNLTDKVFPIAEYSSSAY
ncbi:Bacteroides conjugative transposon TraN protein [Flavobacterium aquidurense]|uniref:Conjugative transposon protein TraN n=1 Tax=Flavobacterium frigidimaris TaxID=262320 RepID=A0ABX4BPT0_FLAFR|nr:conjugative transposon protein TraN [Flavobacterium frigidimaris]OXA78622.1 conjugative transposon protein TraN [Flavobacterium frigidimaris]SDZ57709.1 Bacteroides conjugative transposon TraN protein [Flavobacterium aquidurense]